MAIKSYEALIVSVIGEFGLSQFLIVFTVKLSIVIVAYGMVMTSLTGAEPKWWLHVSYLNTTTNSNETKKYFKTCPSKFHGSGTVVFQNDIRTIVSEWNLVCDKAWVPTTVTTVQMVGAIVSPSLVAHFADGFGRKTSNIATYAIILVSTLGQGLSPNWQTMMVLAFTLGFGIAGLLVVCNIYYIEFVGTKWRTLTFSLPSWSIGVMFLGVVFQVKPDWRYVCFANFVAGCPVLVMYCLAPESIRWLLTHGHTDQAKRTLAKLARFNRRDEADMEAIDEVLQEDGIRDQEGKKYTYCTLLKHKFTRWRIIAFCFMWFSLAFGYYALTFGVGTFEGNKGVNMFLQGGAEFLAIVLVLIVSHLIGRKWSSFAFVALTSASLFGTTIAYFVADTDTFTLANLALDLAAKLFISAGTNSIILFTIETFPTVIRNLAYGLANFCFRVGGALAPQNVALHNISTHLPFTINGALQMISAFMCLGLSDTYSSELDDHFEEEETEDAEKETLLERDGPGDKNSKLTDENVKETEQEK